MRRRSRDDFGRRTRRELALKRILNRYPDQSGMELSNAFLGSDGPLETGALGETGAPGSTGSGAASTRSFSPADLEGSEETRLRELLAELATQAQTASFRVAPNPCVGAAVLSDGVEIGRGIHDAWGGPHAEVAAFAAARASGVDQARLMYWISSGGSQRVDMAQVTSNRFDGSISSSTTITQRPA